MFEAIKRLFGYPRHKSALVITTELVAAANRYKGWERIKEQMLQDIQTRAAGGYVNYSPLLTETRYLEKGSPLRAFLLAEGFKIETDSYYGSPYIEWDAL